MLSALPVCQAGTRVAGPPRRCGTAIDDGSAAHVPHRYADAVGQQAVARDPLVLDDGRHVQGRAARAVLRSLRLRGEREVMVYRKPLLAVTT